jgi:hypothetical protein
MAINHKHEVTYVIDYGNNNYHIDRNITANILALIGDFDRLTGWDKYLVVRYLPQQYITNKMKNDKDVKWYMNHPDIQQAVDMYAV